MLSSIRRGFREFLTLPSVVIASFLVTMLAAHFVDRARPPSLEPLRAFVASHVFNEPTATSSLLAAIASGTMTVTSITVTVLLIAVQQSATLMTGQVFDQFLRRRYNQIYFGFFIGLSLSTLGTLATVNEHFNPVFAATLVLGLTFIALYLLLVLLYSSINQMRPMEVVETIRGHVIASRVRQRELVRKSRRSPRVALSVIHTIRSDSSGYVSSIDIDTIGRAALSGGPDVEIELLVRIGTFVASNDAIAHVRAASPTQARGVERATCEAVRLERERDISSDAAYGIEQLETIGWASISTAKSNPAPGLLVIRALRDLMTRWSPQRGEALDTNPLPVVYTEDLDARVMSSFESLAVVASESMQHRVFVEVLVTIATLIPRLDEPCRHRAEDVVLRILSAMGEFVLTADLEAALLDLALVLERSAACEAARAVRQATAQLAGSVGELHSRASREKPRPSSPGAASSSRSGVARPRRPLRRTSR